MGVSENESVEKVLKKIMVENFPNLVKDTPIRQEAQQTPSRIKSKRSPWDTLQVKQEKAKDKGESWKQKKATTHLVKD